LDGEEKVLAVGRKGEMVSGSVGKRYSVRCRLEDLSSAHYLPGRLLELTYAESDNPLAEPEETIFMIYTSA